MVLQGLDPHCVSQAEGFGAFYQDRRDQILQQSKRFSCEVGRPLGFLVLNLRQAALSSERCMSTLEKTGAVLRRQFPRGRGMAEIRKIEEL